MFVPKRGQTPGLKMKELVTPPNSPNQKTSQEVTITAIPGHTKRIHSYTSGEREHTCGATHMSNVVISANHKHLQQSSSDPITSFQTYKPSKTSRTLDPSDRECLERFLKINARHITDGQGVVGGVLLITPNALMFDPNVSDPLVIEHGAELYGVSVPMEMVLKTALYSDITHMRVKHAPEAVPSAPKPEVYYASEDKLEDDLLLKASCGQIIGSDLNQSPNSDLAQENTDHKSDTTVNTDSNANVEQIKSEDKSDSNESTNCEPNKTQSTSEHIIDSNLINIESDDNEKVSDKASESDEQKISIQEKASDEKIVETVEQNNSIQSEVSDEKVTESEDQKNSIHSEVSDEKVTESDDQKNSIQSGVTDEKVSESEDQKNSIQSEVTDEKVSESEDQKNSIQSEVSDGMTSRSDDQKTCIPREASEEKIVENTAKCMNENNEKGSEAKFNKNKDKEKVFPSHSNEHKSDKLSKPENPVNNKVTLGIRHSVPDTILQDRKSHSTLVTAVSAEDSASADKRRSAQGESRREQMLKRLSNPVDTIGNLTKSGISSGINATKTGISSGINATKTGFNKVLATPKNIVEFSSGLVRDAKDALITSSSGSKGDSLEADVEVFSKGTTSSDNKKLHSFHGSDNRQSSIRYQNMVDTIDVFANFEKLIPRPARSCEDPPLYLCLRMGRPINKKLQTYSPAIISFGKKKIEREYWFSVPKEKADNLYHFFQRWAPEVYGDVDDLIGCDERGLAPIDTDDENEDDETDDGTERDAEDGTREKSSEKPNRPKFWRRRGPLNFLKMVEGHFTADGVSPDWQVVSTDTSGGRVFEVTELPLPELIGSSDVLNDEIRKKLCKHLPARAEGYSWTLIYSSSKHGFSLKTLYREMNKYETPILLIIQDTFGTIFGALISCALRISEHFYGTGETFVFTFYPEFQCFPWTGENLFFVKGNPDSISIGAGDGNFGLWLDGDLFHGRSHPCKTFGNTMLSLQEDFVVKTLECWGFV